MIVAIAEITLFTISIVLLTISAGVLIARFAEYVDSKIGGNDK